MLGNSWVAEWLADSQEGLSSLDLWKLCLFHAVPFERVPMWHDTVSVVIMWLLKAVAEILCFSLGMCSLQFLNYGDMSDLLPFSLSFIPCDDLKKLSLKLFLKALTHVNMILLLLLSQQLRHEFCGNLLLGFVSEGCGMIYMSYPCN
jgi:hypothetical protein